MDNRLQSGQSEAREIFERLMLRINTCLPGIIVDFDDDTQTATVQPAIRMRTMIDGKEAFVDLPELMVVPVFIPFAATKGFALTIPVSKGDECVLVFSQRCIDNWHTEGGVQPPETGAVGSRHHDMSDAFAFVGISSLRNVVGGWEANGIAIRNRANTSKVVVKDDEVVVLRGGSELVMTDDKVVLKSASLEVDAPTKFKKPVVFQSTATLSSGVELTAHKHADPQGGSVGVPV